MLVKLFNIKVNEKNIKLKISYNEKLFYCEAEVDREYNIKFCYQDKSKGTSRRSANNGSIYFIETFYLQLNLISQNILNLS